jgi:hypothetical protein
MPIFFASMNKNRAQPAEGGQIVAFIISSFYAFLESLYRSNTVNPVFVRLKLNHIASAIVIHIYSCAWCGTNNIIQQLHGSPSHSRFV